MTIRIKLFLVLFFMGVVVVGKTQDRFNGSLVFGLNASQIDGDLLAGYNKLGLTGGLKLDYRLENPWYLSLELLYSQRGSQSELLADASIPIRKINLQYIEVPLLVRYKDWWMDEGAYYKVDAELGLSYGYLFNSNSSQGSFIWETDDFSKHDISFTLGANYYITSHWGFGVRYTRSITKLYINPDTDERDLLGYYLSFRSYYQF